MKDSRLLTHIAPAGGNAAVGSVLLYSGIDEKGASRGTTWVPPVCVDAGNRRLCRERRFSVASKTKSEGRDTRCTLVNILHWQITDLRSSVVREMCRTLIALASMMVKFADSELRSFVPDNGLASCMNVLPNVWSD